MVGLIIMLEVYGSLSDKIVALDTMSKVNQLKSSSNKSMGRSSHVLTDYKSKNSPHIASITIKIVGNNKPILQISIKLITNLIIYNWDNITQQQPNY